MHYRITHKTLYEYSEPVSLCHNLAHLTPRDTHAQRCLHTSLSVRPQPAVFSRRADYFGNPAVFFAVQEPHRELTVTAHHLVELSPPEPPDPTTTPPWEEVRDGLPLGRTREALEAYGLRFDSRYAAGSKELLEYATPSFPPGQPILAGVLDLTHRIHEDFVYDPRATTVATPLREVFANRRGVCQDFAHLQIACLRSLGLSARYVSGYLCTVPPPGQPRLVGADATHAWVAAFCPATGWVEVDPTNDQIPSDKHLLLAWGRDYEDVSPIKGVILGGGQHTVRVSVDVVRTDMAEELSE